MDDDRGPGPLFYGHDVHYPEAQRDIESGRSNITWELRHAQWTGHGLRVVAGNDLAMVECRSPNWPSVARNQYFDAKRGFWMVDWDAVAQEMGWASGVRAAVIWLISLDRDLDWRFARWLERRGQRYEGTWETRPNGPASATLML